MSLEHRREETGLEEKEPPARLEEAAQRTFLFVRGNLTPKQALDLATASHSEQAVLQVGPSDHPTYYLLSVDHLWEMLDCFDGPTVAAVGRRLEPVPALEGYLEAAAAPDRCVVLEDGHLIGYFDRRGEAPDVYRGRHGDPDELETLPRLLAAEMERRVEPEQTLSLLVFFTRPDLGEQAPCRGLPVSLPEGSAVDLYVRTQGPVEVEGSREQRLIVPRGDTSLPVQFRMRAGEEPGEGRVELLAFFRGSCLGRLVLPVTVEERLRTRSMGTEARGANDPPLLGVDPRWTTDRWTGTRRYDFALYADPSPRADLTLNIQERRGRADPSRIELEVRVWAADSSIAGETYEPIRLESDFHRRFQGFFEKLEGLGGGTAKEQKRSKAQLERKGAELYEALFPEELRARLWELRPRIKTIAIESDEPGIPWELCRLVGRDGDRTVEGPFLCEQFNMGRWILGVRRKSSLAIHRAGLITPLSGASAGGREEAEQFRTTLCGAEASVEAIDSEYVTVLSALASARYDALHFAGHGNFQLADPDADSLLNLNPEEHITPEDISGEVANLGRRTPLVFLNACQSGRVGRGLVDRGGWAPRLLKAGAGVFLAPLWSVDGQLARLFAKTFYEALAHDGQPVGEAVRRARLAVREEFPGDPAWLAYSLYADPLLKPVLGDAEEVAA